MRAARGGVARRRHLGTRADGFLRHVNEFIDNTEAEQSSRIKAGTKLVSIGSGDVFIHSNYQDFQRYQAVDIAIAADAEATLPSLVEAVRREITPARKAVIEKRGQAAQATYAQAKERMRSDAAAAAWDASPVSSARLVAELWPLIRNEDWALVGRALGGWPQRMWNFDKYYQHIGGSGGAGVGYNLPSAVGAALAHKEHGRFAVNIQPDGDCMYAPGAIWTSAHHKSDAHRHEQQPRLSSGGHASAAHGHVASAQHGPLAYRHHDPRTLCQLCQARRRDGRGRHRPDRVARRSCAALKRGVDIVKKGEPVIIDVVMQPR